jgi:hypothetical protein
LRPSQHLPHDPAGLGAVHNNKITREVQMKIIGVEGLTNEQVNDEVGRGGRFVMYQYCISVLVMTFKRPSNIYFMKAGERSFGKGIGFSLMTLLLGWWGIPWGPIYTIQSLWVNFSGGRDVTKEIMAQSAAPAGAIPLPQT